MPDNNHCLSSLFVSDILVLQQFGLILYFVLIINPGFGPWCVVCPQLNPLFNYLSSPAVTWQMACVTWCHGGLCHLIPKWYLLEWRGEDQAFAHWMGQKHSASHFHLLCPAIRDRLIMLIEWHIPLRLYDFTATFFKLQNWRSFKDVSACYKRCHTQQTCNCTSCANGCQKKRTYDHRRKPAPDRNVMHYGIILRILCRGPVEIVLANVRTLLWITHVVNYIKQ